MDETTTRLYRWIGANSPHFFWIVWGMLIGGCLSAILSATAPLEWLEKHGEMVIAAFTVVLAVSTIGLWIATVRLWQAGERQIRVAHRAATSASESADAAHAAVEQAQITAVRQLRAYVTITKHRALRYRLAIGHTILPCVTIKNRGQTPAHEVTVTVQASFDGPDQKEAFL